jgi:NAD(P)-dependent dehydrogenase (short-subunit alcohol dehydrogenase family)
LIATYHETFHAEMLDVTDTPAIHEVVERSFAQLGRIDVLISNAGYGLFGAAEELTDEQVEHIIATNLIGPIQLIRAALPHLRAQGGGRIIRYLPMAGRSPFGQLPVPRDQVGHRGLRGVGRPGSRAFGIGMTIVEPAARVPGSATVAQRRKPADARLRPDAGS